MIEVVYNKKDEEATKSSEIKLPKNIRQIGNGNSKRKIYIEDYVVSYINELAGKSKGKRIVGVLLGENVVSEEAKYLFIKGTIKVRDDEFIEGRIILTEKSWSGIYEDIRKYFPTLSILGWFLIIDEVETVQKGSLEKTHVDNFAGCEKTLFLFETDKCEQGFYFYENGKLVKENGYYIYYERNEDMQEYMVYDDKQLEEEQETMKEVVKEKKEHWDSHRLLNFMYTVCTFLVVVVLIMAINIMAGNRRLENIETGVDNLGKVAMVEAKVKRTEPVTDVQENVTTPEPLTETISETTTETTITETEALVTEAEKEKYMIHKVNAGENLAIISKMYYGDTKHIDAIMELNKIKNPDKIYPGQELKLPKIS